MYIAGRGLKTACKTELLLCVAISRDSRTSEKLCSFAKWKNESMRVTSEFKGAKSNAATVGLGLCPRKDTHGTPPRPRPRHPQDTPTTPRDTPRHPRDTSRNRRDTPRQAETPPRHPRDNPPRDTPETPPRHAETPPRPPRHPHARHAEIPPTHHRDTPETRRDTARHTETPDTRRTYPDNTRPPKILRDNPSKKIEITRS